MKFKEGQVLSAELTSLEAKIKFSHGSKFILNSFIKKRKLHMYIYSRAQDDYYEIGDITNIDYKTNIVTFVITFPEVINFPKDADIIYEVGLFGLYDYHYSKDKEGNLCCKFIIRRGYNYRFVMETHIL